MPQDIITLAAPPALLRAIISPIFVMLPMRVTMICRYYLPLMSFSLMFSFIDTYFSCCLLMPPRLHYASTLRYARQRDVL